MAWHFTDALVNLENYFWGVNCSSSLIFPHGAEFWMPDQVWHDGRRGWRARKPKTVTTEENFSAESELKAFRIYLRTDGARCQPKDELTCAVPKKIVF